MKEEVTRLGYNNKEIKEPQKWVKSEEGKEISICQLPNKYFQRNNRGTINFIKDKCSRVDCQMQFSEGKRSDANFDKERRNVSNDQRNSNNHQICMMRDMTAESMENIGHYNLDQQTVRTSH